MSLRGRCPRPTAHPALLLASLIDSPRWPWHDALWDPYGSHMTLCHVALPPRAPALLSSWSECLRGHGRAQCVILHPAVGHGQPVHEPPSGRASTLQPPGVTSVTSRDCGSSDQLALPPKSHLEFKFPFVRPQVREVVLNCERWMHRGVSTQRLGPRSLGLCGSCCGYELGPGARVWPGHLDTPPPRQDACHLAVETKQTASSPHRKRPSGPPASPPGHSGIHRSALC